MLALSIQPALDIGSYGFRVKWKVDETTSAAVSRVERPVASPGSPRLSGADAAEVVNAAIAERCPKEMFA